MGGQGILHLPNGSKKTRDYWFADEEFPVQDIAIKVVRNKKSKYFSHRYLIEINEKSNEPFPLQTKSTMGELRLL